MYPSAPSAILPEATARATKGGWTMSSSASATERGLTMGAGRGHRGVSGVDTVANLRGACDPAAGEEYISFTAQGARVITDVDTDFFIDAEEEPIEGGCANLRNGTKVRVIADSTQNEDFSYTAQTITIIDQPGGPPPTPVEGEGVVAALRGECPSLTMVVHGYPVMTVSATVFEGGTCASIAPGTRVRVEGVLGGNSVVANTVEILP